MSSAVECISRGYQARKEGNLPVAQEHYGEGARLHRESGDLLAYAHAIRHIADMYQDEKDFGAARSLYEEALEIYRSNLHTKLLDLANTVRPYALLNEEQGNLGLALDLWTEARSLYGSLRIGEGVSECATHVARLKQA
jgi:tetratricopeptide (TPR) repeat protein